VQLASDDRVQHDDPATRNGWRHGEVVANGVRLHYVEAGRPGGELVLLLHGFPESWYSWRHQIGALASNGRRVVALDLPGFGQSDRPAGIVAYRLDTLAEDIVACVDQLADGRPAAAIVGHDWGGSIAWSVGALYPATARRLAIINCPPAYAWRRAWRSPKQALKSWYVFLFQLPRLPEALLRAGGLRFVDQSLEPARRRNPDGVTAEDIAYQRAEMARPGALTAGLNYYRAVMRLEPAVLGRLAQTVRVPTLLIWGDNDPYAQVELVRDFPSWASAGRLEHLPNAGHFSHQEEPERVNQLLGEWLAA
jgi:pimeloyl-ACP methyl ester carboxylesterase